VPALVLANVLAFKARYLGTPEKPNWLIIALGCLLLLLALVATWAYP